MALATDVDLTEFTDRKVKLVYLPEGKEEAVEMEGTVQSANALAVLIKPKGKTTFELIEASSLEDIDFLDEKPKELKRRELQVISFGNARNHLTERHGLTLTSINEMTEQVAYEIHKGVDHLKEDLGHEHIDKDATERADAVAAAESNGSE